MRYKVLDEVYDSLSKAITELTDAISHLYDFSLYTYAKDKYIFVLSGREEVATVVGDMLSDCVELHIASASSPLLKDIVQFLSFTHDWNIGTYKWKSPFGADFLLICDTPMTPSYHLHYLVGDEEYATFEAAAEADMYYKYTSAKLYRVTCPAIDYEVKFCVLSGKREEVERAIEAVKTFRATFTTHALQAPWTIEEESLDDKTATDIIGSLLGYRAIFMYKDIVVIDDVSED